MSEAPKMRAGKNHFSRLGIFLAALLFGALSAFAANDFGDVSVTPISVADGDTHHGYREFRVLVENHSSKSSHEVTLVIPDKAYNYGNSISRLSRTVTVGPLARAMVPLWQPPLPVGGNGMMRVVVDGENDGAVNMPNASRHGTAGFARGYGYPYGGGGPMAPTAVLVSRSLNFDEMNHAFNATASAGNNSAKMATGPPNASGRRGVVPTAWMPDPGNPNPQWIELDYSNPKPANRVRIFTTLPLPPGTELVLRSASGTNLYTTNIMTTAPRGRAMTEQVDFPQTKEDVKTVRLEFRTGFNGSISIDAVELAGPSGTAWAADARASSEATGVYGGPPMGAGGQRRGLLRSELPMSEWSDSWLSYTPYDGVALSAADVKALSPAALNALWGYLECGGNLFIFGANSVPEPWRSYPDAGVNGECREVGVGRCFAFEEDQVSSLSNDETKRMLEAADNTARYWMGLPDIGTLNQVMPVIANYRIPLRSTVFLMLLFVIAIGPVNIIVLTKKKRRVWLLWTIPAISCFTSLTVFAYSFLAEGITPDTRISGLTILDQANRRAASVGYTSFYCPLTPSQGLFFSPETEATPLMQNAMWDYRSGTDHELDWSQSQHFTRGWVSARVPAGFELRKSETRRERLQVENVNGQLSVVNGLGAPIQNLWLADGDSKVYIVTNLAAGQKIQLPASTQSLKRSEEFGARALLEKCGPQANLADATTYLRPNTYIAELEANPFLENGLGPKAKSARTRAHAVVYGLLESNAKP